MKGIHPSAVVAKSAEIGRNVSIGPNSIVEDGVVIGDGCAIASNALPAEGTVLGQEVSVAHGAVIGTAPQDLKFAGEDTKAIIGDKTVVREYATINRGTAASGKTSIGCNALIMAYAHVAHDCVIGDNVIMANSVNLAGHIEIEEYAILGGVLPVHQFVKIGAHAMIGGGFRVQQDIAPYALAAGYPLRIVGINSIGLKRRGFARVVIKHLEQAFRILFFSKLNTSQAVQRIHNDVEIIPEVQHILDFIDRSERGLVK